MWYLPHYPVKHPLKPNKGEAGSWLFSKVWTNITSSWWHRSKRHFFRSNVSPIHGGPKRLWHFLNLKRFVWWPNRDLAKKMQEYRMVKHLFGATSSPSVANVCPRKTAQRRWSKAVARLQNKTRQISSAEGASHLGGLGAGPPPRKFWNLEAQKCSSKHFPWHFRKFNLRPKSRRGNCLRFYWSRKETRNLFVPAFKTYV